MARRRPKTVDAVAARLALRAHKRLGPQADALSLRYAKADAELRVLVARALLEGKLESAVYRARLARRVDAMMKALHQLGEPRAKKLVDEAYEAGVRIAGEQEHSTINKTALDILEENLTGRLQDATRVVGRRAKDVFRREGLRFAAAQIADEHDLPVVRDQFVRQLQRQGVTAFIDARGRSWSLETYAEMAIKTATHEAQNQGVVTTMTARGLDLVDVRNPTGGCPRICREHVNKTYSITGRARGYPILLRTAPFHPGCECFLVPARKAFEERELAAA